MSRCCWGPTTVSWTNWCGRTDNHRRNSLLHKLPSVNHCRRSWGLSRYLCAKWTLCRTLSFIHSFSRHSCSVCLMSDVSRGSAAMCVRCGEKCRMGFVGNLPDFPAVKEFWKSVKIWRRYHHELVVAVLMATWCILHVNECGYVSAIKCHVTRRSWRLIQSGWFVFIYDFSSLVNISWNHFCAFANTNRCRESFYFWVIQLAGPPLSIRLLLVNMYFAWCRCNISVLSRTISMRLGTNIHHVSGHCCKGFQGQRSEVKVIAWALIYNMFCGRVIHFDSAVSSLTCLLK